MTSDEQLWWVVAYIARNPVAAGLCAKPEDWRWSSHGAGDTPPRWLEHRRLLRHFGSSGGDPADRYTAAVRA